MFTHVEDRKRKMGGLMKDQRPLEERTKGWHVGREGEGLGSDIGQIVL